MAVNIKFTAQENEVIASLRAMGGETARLVDENIKLANSYAKSDAELKFFNRGLGKLKQAEDDMEAVRQKRILLQQQAAEKAAIEKTKRDKAYLAELDKMGQAERDFSAAQFKHRQIQEKAAEKAAAQSVRIANTKAKEIEKAANIEARAVERAEREKQRAIAYAERERIKAQDRLVAEKDRKNANFQDAILSAVGFQMSGPLAGVGGALGGGAGLAVGASLDGLLAVGKEVVNVTEKYSRLQIALDSATGSTNMGARSMAFIVDLASKTGQRIETLAGSYKTLAANARGTSLEGAGVEKIFSSITKAASAMQLSNEQIKGSLKAIGDMMNKGKIQAEELTQQFSENFPGGAKIFADALGISTAELFKLGEQGKLISAEVLPKVAAYMEKISKDDYAKNLNTITGSMNNFKNELDLVIYSFGKESNINSFFAAIINGAASVLKSGALTQLSEQMLAMIPGVGSIYVAYNALKKPPIKGAPSLQEQQKFGAQSIKEQAAQLQVLYSKMQDLKKLANPKNNIANDSDALKKAQVDLIQIIATYSTLKSVYESAKISAAAAAKTITTGTKTQQKSLVDLNKEIKENTRLYVENVRNIPNYQASEAGKTSLAKIDSLKAEYNTLKSLSSTSKGASFDTLIRKQAEESKDIVATALAAIKTETINLKIQELATEAVKKSGLMVTKSGPVRDTQGGFPLGEGLDLNDRLNKQIGLDSLQKDINKRIGQIIIDPSKIKVAPIKGVEESLSKRLRELSENMDSNIQNILFDGMTSTLISGFEIVGQNIAAGENPFQGFGEMILKSYAEVLAKIGQEMLVTGAALIIPAIAAGGAGLGKALGMTVLGGAMITASSGLKAAKFAQGAIVSGPTYSMTGEYPNARNNPEVIAPLSKLSQLFQPYFQKAINLSGGGQNYAMQPVYLNPTVYLDGKVLATQLQKVYIQKGRTN